MKRALLACAAAAVTLGVTGCGQPYTGINSLPLPGTVGTGADSYEIKVQLHNADNLVANTPVYVNDINIGTTTLVALENGWTPTLTLSIKKDVKLPANATAAMAQTSLLGSKHIDLITPANPVGTLEPGAVIKEDRIKQFPQTEDLLAGVSTLLNGGGLQHFQTVTTELNRALGNGRDKDARELLTQLATFSERLDQQTGDIVFALKGLDHLGTTIAPRLGDIDKALQQIPRGLDTVNDLEPQLVSTLEKLGDGASAIAPFAHEGSEQLTEVLEDLERPLKYTGDIQSASIPRALRMIPFVIFPMDNIPFTVRGDYANVVAPVNLTLDSLDKNLFGGTVLSGSLHSVAEAARRSNNPNSAPVPPLTQIPDFPAPALKAPAEKKSPLPSLPKIGN